LNTFEITFKRKTGNAWPVTVRHEPGGSSLALWSSGSLAIDLEQLGAAAAANRQYGMLLGKGLFREDIQDAFVRAVAEAKSRDETLRVFLNVEAEDLRGLHWEQLCARFDRGWDYLLLNQQTPFSLYLPSQIERRFAPIGRRDLRALLLVAGTEDLGQTTYPMIRPRPSPAYASPGRSLHGVGLSRGWCPPGRAREQITKTQPTLPHRLPWQGDPERGETALYSQRTKKARPSRARS
jgi:hypothetical protein